MSAINSAPSAPASPEMSPARTALAEAIGRYVAAEAERARLAAGAAYDGPAAQAIREAERAHEKALEDMETAKAGAVNHLTGATDTAPALSIRAARAALLDAEDAIEVARSVRKSIKEMLTSAEKAADWKKSMIRFAIDAVLKDEIGPRQGKLLADIRRLQAELAAKEEILSFLTGRAFNNSGAPGPVEVPRKGVGEWIEALDRLQADAAAPLPAL